MDILQGQFAEIIPREIKYQAQKMGVTAIYKISTDLSNWGLYGNWAIVLNDGYFIDVDAPHNLKIEQIITLIS